MTTATSAGAIAGRADRIVAPGSVPWAIVPATQFHDFAAMAAGWTEHDGVATIAPLPLPLAGVMRVALNAVDSGDRQQHVVTDAGPGR